MKALSLTQPYATLVATGAKQFETRSWKTSYRGPLAIHAAKGFPTEARQFAAMEHTLGRLPGRVPLGCIVAVVTVVDMLPTEEAKLGVSALERLYGDYSWGRWAWKLRDVKMLKEPIPARGAQGLWNWEPPANLEELFL
jgi:activating signal cointegrator 1